MDQLKRLREKKGMHKMHPMAQKAKMNVLDHMSKMAEEAMGDKLKDMHKVSVASDSKEGLEAGLDKAHDVLNSLPEAFDDSHHDHENFAASEDKEDGEDGMSAYPDSDGDHQLEADPAAEHDRDEAKEGDNDEEGYDEGGEVNPLEEPGSPEPDEMYSHMDEGEINEHLKRLLKHKKQKGMK
jgi:hypothetical protein